MHLQLDVLLLSTRFLAPLSRFLAQIEDRCSTLLCTSRLGRPREDESFRSRHPHTALRSQPLLYRSRPWPFILPWKIERFYESRLLILAYPCSRGLGPVTLEELPVLEEARATTSVVQPSSGCDCFRQDYENIKSMSSHRVACRSSSRRHTACEASSPPRRRCTKHQHPEP